MTRRNMTFRWQAFVVVAVLGAGWTLAGSAIPKFYPDDPLTVDPEGADASRVKPRDVGRSYIGWQMIHATADHTWRRAMNVNAIDEVPDSSWFTNRFGSGLPSTDTGRLGPDRPAGPPQGPWTVIAGKSDGVTPGLQLRDSTGQR